MPAKLPSISAALIVKDEERFLDGCLTSLAGNVDEIVVVDTGSSDRTTAIAEKYFARLLRQSWNGDFSEARNIGLEASTGDWVLYIDADERLHVPHGMNLATMISGQRIAAACVQFMPKTGFTRYREPRLFLNRPDIRFRGQIHETVMPDIDRLCLDQGFSVVMTKARIDHLGYDGNQDHKYVRNLPLLESMIAGGQTRVYYYYHLAETLAGLERIDDAIRVGREGLAIAHSNDNEKNRADASLIYQMLARIVAPGETSLALIEEGMARFPSDHALRFQLAQQLVQLKRHQEALRHLELLRAIDADTLEDGLLAFDRRIFGEFAWQLIGACLMATGRRQKALQAFRAAAG